MNLCNLYNRYAKCEHQATRHVCFNPDQNHLCNYLDIPTNKTKPKDKPKETYTAKFEKANIHLCQKCKSSFSAKYKPRKGKALCRSCREEHRRKYQKKYNVKRRKNSKTPHQKRIDAIKELNF